jgi:hypothetical protein
VAARTARIGPSKAAMREATPETWELERIRVMVE